ncbi:MAG TPA: ABC transporter permease [Tepidisphaeraceae bacterium]|jgi:ribose transport system permease protein|nr:ABC transporter permease [Tepidisphaeraceae bacterium]
MNTATPRRFPLPIDQLGLLLVLAILILSFGLTTPFFLTTATFSTIANQIPATLLISVGMTYVLIIGGIDLSVGSILGLSGGVIGVLMTGPHPQSLLVAALAALATGMLCGLVNGLVTVTWSIPSFVVTLGMLEIARGAAHWLTASRTAYIGTPAGALADSSLAGLSLPFYLSIASVLIGQFVLSRTTFGRYMVAVGTNEEAVRLSGISTRPIKTAVFIIAGFLSAAGAVMDVSRSQASNPNAGTGLELDVIAAVVIGGTSLLGGRGSVISSLLGVAIVSVLSAGLAARGVHDETKRLITGTVIIAAVILDYYRHRFTQRNQ